MPAVCPHCFGELTETHVDHQYQTEIPHQHIHRQIDIHCGVCTRCGQTVRGHHPLQTSEATGAAASQLGPDAQTAVVLLQKQAGLSHGKVARVMGELFGLSLTRGAVTQIVLRAGRKLQPAYQEIRAQLPQQEWLSVDETGWRVGGQPAWLHVWVGGTVTCYAIDPQRGADALEEVIGRDWSGKLIHDGWASYDRFTEAVHQQCVAHVLRRGHDLEETQTGRAKAFPRRVIELFQGALQVRDAFVAGQIDRAALEKAQEDHVGQLLEISQEKYTNAENRKLAEHLYAHGEQWLMVLWEPEHPATN